MPQIINDQYVLSDDHRALTHIEAGPSVPEPRTHFVVAAEYLHVYCAVQRAQDGDTLDLPDVDGVRGMTQRIVALLSPALQLNIITHDPVTPRPQI
jgi:hypothetical protein